MASIGTDNTLTMTSGTSRSAASSSWKRWGRLAHVAATRHDRTVAGIVPPRSEPLRLWGAHRGSATVAPGVDLTGPVLDELLDAELGVLHR
jgi:hypothetical protein